MTDEEREVSYRQLRIRLAIVGLVDPVNATEEDLRVGLLKLLSLLFGADALWAVRDVLRDVRPCSDVATA